MICIPAICSLIVCNKVLNPFEVYNHLAWAGCVAYPWEGAMRRPEIKDGREVRISHAFFVSIYFMFNWPRHGERVGIEFGKKLMT